SPLAPRLHGRGPLAGRPPGLRRGDGPGRLARLAGVGGGGRRERRLPPPGASGGAVSRRAAVDPRRRPDGGGVAGDDQLARAPPPHPRLPGATRPPLRPLLPGRGRPAARPGPGRSVDAPRPPLHRRGSRTGGNDRTGMGGGGPAATTGSRRPVEGRYDRAARLGKAPGRPPGRAARVDLGGPQRPARPLPSPPPRAGARPSRIGAPPTLSRHVSPLAC